MIRSSPFSSVWFRVALPVVAVVLAVAVRIWFLEDLGVRLPFLTFFYAVLFSAFIGGRACGLLATFLSLIVVVWLQPVDQLSTSDPKDWVKAFLFILVGAGFSWFSQVLHKALGKAAEAESLRLLVNERDRAIKELRQSRAMLSSVIESLPFDFWAVGLDGRYILLNTHAKEAWGDLTGKRPDETGIMPDVSRSWLEINARALAGEMVRSEASFERLGEPGVFDIVAVPILDGERIVGALGVSVDITERKRIEEYLCLANEKAQAASHAKSTFLANMSHEIRTPPFSHPGTDRTVPARERPGKDRSRPGQDRGGRAVLYPSAPRFLSNWSR